MRAVSTGLLIAGAMAVLGYVLQGFLPDSSVITVNWSAHQYFVPYNIAAFWACVTLGAVAGAVQAIRGLLSDVGRLR